MGKRKRLSRIQEKNKHPNTMVHKEIKDYLIALIIVLVIDLTWIFLLMNSFYNQQFSLFLRPNPAPIWSAILAWLLIPLGISLFVEKVSKNYKQSFFYGAAYGFILYGVYDFTNYATLANWPIILVIVDVLWGTFLCAVSSLILKIIKKRWLK